MLVVYYIYYIVRRKFAAVFLVSTLQINLTTEAAFFCSGVVFCCCFVVVVFNINISLARWLSLYVRGASIESPTQKHAYSQRQRQNVHKYTQCVSKCFTPSQPLRLYQGEHTVHNQLLYIRV